MVPDLFLQRLLNGGHQISFILHADQLLLNLVNNAVTYTDTGGQVSLTIEEGEELPNHYADYRLSVEDTGIGIGEELGWNIDQGYIEPSFSCQLAEDGTPCLVISYLVGPRYDFRNG